MNKLWIWNWKQGGYNSVIAIDRKEAIAKAIEMTKSINLEVDEDSIHEGTYFELACLDRKHGTFFD